MPKMTVNVPVTDSPMATTVMERVHFSHGTQNQGHSDRFREVSQPADCFMLCSLRSILQASFSCSTQQKGVLS